MTQPAWIAVDWGTTHLRVWAMSDTHNVLDHRQSDRGMGKLAQDEFEVTLESLCDGWDISCPMIACGMVGSRQGWVEAPYQAVPCPPLSPNMVTAPAANLSVRVIPGIKQNKPADVMRGEETQIAGYLLENPDFDGVLCLPGTHSKWAHISAGEIVSFQTLVTGELFSLLANKSVLRHSVGEGWDDAAFADAVSDTISRPDRLASRLFGLRANDLLFGKDGAETRAQLSGMLIGAELAATKPYWLGQQVVVIGASGISNAYEQALSAQGLSVTRACGDAMTLAGLTAAYQTLKDTL
ncbi:2-dehydro-3-deoxygalactonokinase [Aestuariibius sp. HNIBRBA575]|uniref:2-dehydro-3-deoxygalactonokinase n=1 Tax=Aestuariibius sp. HNIBRBA575 TaxID=3233343 RepID=UPI0034A2DA56